jgi:hypothetical protein
MKLPLLALLLATTGFDACSDEAVGVAALNSGGAVADQGAGFAFRAKTNLLINSLGFQFNQNFQTARVDIVNAAGMLLAYAVLNTNSSKLGLTHYEPIAPLMIRAGTTNFVRGYMHQGTNMNVPDKWVGGYLPVDQVAVADEVAYLGSGVGLDLSSYFPDFFFQGANFQFSVLPPVELRLTRTASNYVQLSWRADAGSYVLQTAPRLGVTMTNALPPAVLAGTNRVVFVPMDTTNRFFRLVW